MCCVWKFKGGGGVGGGGVGEGGKCKTREKSIFSEKWQNSKLLKEYRLKTWKIYKSQMTKQTSRLDLSRKI